MEEIPDQWRENKRSLLEDVPGRTWPVSAAWGLLLAGALLVSVPWWAVAGPVVALFGLQVSLLGVVLSLVFGMIAIWLMGLIFRTDFGPAGPALLSLLAYVTFSHGLILSACALRAYFPESTWPTVLLIGSPLVGIWLLLRLFDLDLFECIMLVVARTTVEGMVGLLLAWIF